MSGELSVRLFLPADAGPLSELIGRTLREVNGRDYPPEEVAALAARYSPAYLASVAREGSLYVAVREGALAGCGAVTPHRDRPGDACVMAVFTHPEALGRGVGSAVMAAVEGDPIFQNARRAELHASVTARGFYERLGYVPMDDPPVLRDGCWHMEKKKE